MEEILYEALELVEDLLVALRYPARNGKAELDRLIDDVGFIKQRLDNLKR